MLIPGSDVTLSVEKPAAGGRMIARHAGQVVLVSGALPGERVRARVERCGRGVIFAAATEILDAHPDRRSLRCGRPCGGTAYAHIAYSRQLDLKAEVVADAFVRIARLPLEAAVAVHPSPETGYRMRARLHVTDRQVGFYREGTHELCDPAETAQLLPGTTRWLQELSSGDAAWLDAVAAIELSENIPATERAVHLELEARRDPPSTAALSGPGVTGLTCSGPEWREPAVLGGTPYVTDTVAVGASRGRLPTSIALRHHVCAFFQANRYLISDLASRVVDSVPDGDVVDLYAGVGLFGVSIAAGGIGRVTAVEGNRTSVEDLRVNAMPYGEAVRVHGVPVEEYLRARSSAAPSTLIVDPPRTGMSREAVDRLIVWGAARVVYVSCDVATLARDVRKMADAGYGLEHVEAFDLFPNTGHVEVLVVLDKRQTSTVFCRRPRIPRTTP